MAVLRRSSFSVNSEPNGKERNGRGSPPPPPPSITHTHTHTDGFNARAEPHGIMIAAAIPAHLSQ